MSLACPKCGLAIPAAMLACPSCGQLVHASELKRLAAQAETAQSAGDHLAALTAWRSALPLLPPDSRQHQVVREKVEALSRTVAASGTDAGSAAAPPSWIKRLGPFGGIALFFWKFKFIALAILSKAKLLFLGLTKASTLFSMMLSMAAYWALYGWKFGVGFIASIYVHEMGHVAALRRFGIPATAPMFIPGVGAFVRLGSHPATVVEDATVGLAGPIWGLGAALLCFAIWTASGSGASAWGALAHAGAWLNLFNLLPVWQLDGSRGFAALSQKQRWLIAAAFGLAWLLTSEGLLILLALVAGVRAMSKEAPREGDRGTLLTFLTLIVVLSFLVAIPVAGRR